MTDNNTHLAWIDEKITHDAKSTLKYLWSIVGPIAKSDLGPQSVCVSQFEVANAIGESLDAVKEHFRTLTKQGWILRIDQQWVPNRKGRSTRLAWKAPDAFGLLNAAETVQAKQIESDPQPCRTGETTMSQDTITEPTIEQHKAALAVTTIVLARALDGQTTKRNEAERNVAELLEAVGLATGQRLSTMPTAEAVAAAKAALARLTPVTFEGAVR